MLSVGGEGGVTINGLSSKLSGCYQCRLKKNWSRHVLQSYRRGTLWNTVITCLFIKLEGRLQSLHCMEDDVHNWLYRTATEALAKWETLSWSPTSSWFFCHFLCLFRLIIHLTTGFSSSTQMGFRKSIGYTYCCSSLQRYFWETWGTSANPRISGKWPLKRLQVLIIKLVIVLVERNLDYMITADCFCRHNLLL